MDIGSLSMSMSQSKVQTTASIALMKMAMNSDNENIMQITEMLQNSAVDSNLGSNLDVRV